MTNTTYVAKVIHTIRTTNGLSQEAFAKKAGLKSAQQVSNWERGASIPTAPRVKNLCRAFKSSRKVLVDAMLNDYKTYLKKYLN